jgi:integrase/recombinase XerD
VKFSDGISQYIARKYARDHVFEKGKANLTAFSRQLGDVDLSQVKTDQVLKFLNGAGTGAITWRLKYQVLSRFFDFWFSRGVMPRLLMPPPRPKVRQTFVPYVFTRAEVRGLLKAAREDSKPVRSIDQQTLRAIILVLYGTGALVGEVLALKQEDVDLENRMITIKNRNLGRSRKIPIGSDLSEILQKYVVWRSSESFQCSSLFVTKDDHSIPNHCMNKNFRRLRQIAGVIRSDGSPYQSRMDDLRYTFAVHRITSWIRNGDDLNRMLPALAAYMGQAGMGSTERYLSMTPERFRKELNKLSPDRREGHWRNNKILMDFLAGL